MKCTLVDINRGPHDCIEDKCYFWDLEQCKYKLMLPYHENIFLIDLLI
jgi:hypothetical protein